MRKIIQTAVAAASILGAVMTPVAQAAAAPDPRIVFGVNGPDDQAVLEHVQLYLWGGRRYCWYEGGWHGPGFYWCGYAWRRGWGWGGPWGWRGWYGPREWGERHGYHDWHGGPGWRDGDRGRWNGRDGERRWDGGDRGHWNGRNDEHRGNGDRGHWGGDHPR